MQSLQRSGETGRRVGHPKGASQASGDLRVKQKRMCYVGLQASQQPGKSRHDGIIKPGLLFDDVNDPGIVELFG